MAHAKLTAAGKKALALFVAEGVVFRIGATAKNTAWFSPKTGERVDYRVAKNLSENGLIAYSGKKTNGGLIEHWHVTDKGRRIYASTAEGKGAKP